MLRGSVARHLPAYRLDSFFAWAHTKFFLLTCMCSGAQGQLGHTQYHALNMMGVNHAYVMDSPRKIDSLDPNRLQPWKR